MFKLKVLYVVFIGLALTLSCSKNHDLPTDPGGGPSNALDITVLPSSGLPGTLIEISGYDIDQSDSSIVIYVGDEPTVFISDSSGIQAIVPLFLDSASHWPSPPLGALDVEIRSSDKVLARASSALTVDSLLHADGATEKLKQDFVVLANSLRTIWSLLPIIPGGDSTITGYRQAVMTMLDSLLTGGDSSLASVLSGTSSWTNGQEVDLALIDALYSSSGALEYYNDAASSIGQLTTSLNRASEQGLFCKGGGPDMDLACEMQIYVVLDDYANYFVKPTAKTYANTVGLAAGILAIGGITFPPEKIISALVVVFDFVYGTLAPSLFPAEITEFSLDVATDTIDIDEYTSTTIKVAAVNNPATITATDVLEYLLTALGLANAPTGIAQSFREVLVNAMKWVLGLYRKGVEQYNKDTNNSVFIDPEADLPLMYWGPVVVTHSELVNLFSLTEDIIIGDDAEFEWKGVARGEGRIQARVVGPGERSKVLIDNSLCLGCIYSGAAFGNNAPGTTNETVVVGKPVTLDVRITGLPTGTDASVIVTGPDGYSSGALTASALLKDLQPGDYHLTAIEVKDGTGETYKAVPMDTTVTFKKGDKVLTVTVTYVSKYGSIYLVVNGLDLGEAGNVPADIRLEGPDSYVKIIQWSTLIDSLLPGRYDILASEVDDQWGQTYIPDPDVSELIVEGGNTATLIIEHKPKFGFLTVRANSVPRGIEADIDVTGPDQFFHHVSSSEESIDSLLEGEYIINAFEIIDSIGDTLTPSPLTQVVTVIPGQYSSAAVDYSGSNYSLTIHITGLPASAQAIVSVTGPNGYSALVIGDTTLTGLESSEATMEQYVLKVHPVTFAGIVYKSTLAFDWSIYLFSDQSVTLEYVAQAEMIVSLGGAPESPKPKPLINMLSVSKRDAGGGNWNTVFDTSEYPKKNDLPTGLSKDSCNFWNERMILNGTYPHTLNVSTPYSNASADLTFDVSDTSALISFSCDINVNSPGTTQGNYARSQFSLNLGDLMKIVLKNPDSANSSLGQIAISLAVTFTGSDSTVYGIVKWDSEYKSCGDTYPRGNIQWLDEWTNALVPDTTVTFGNSTGLVAYSNEIKQMMNYISVELKSRRTDGIGTSTGRVEGELRLTLKQRH